MEVWDWAVLGAFGIGYVAAASYVIEVLRVSIWLVVPLSMLGGAAAALATRCAAHALLS